MAMISFWAASAFVCLFISSSLLSICILCAISIVKCYGYAYCIDWRKNICANWTCWEELKKPIEIINRKIKRIIWWLALQHTCALLHSSLCAFELAERKKTEHLIKMWQMWLWLGHILWFFAICAFIHLFCAGNGGSNRSAFLPIIWNHHKLYSLMIFYFYVNFIWEYTQK